MLKPFDVLVCLKVDATNERAAIERVEAAFHTLGMRDFGMVDARPHEPTEPRHLFEVFDRRDGARDVVFYVDKSDEATARQVAHRRAAERNRGDGPAWFEVRELGAPDRILPSQFTKAILAGYTVNPDGSKGWQWNHDQSGDGCAGYSSERAAWEACDRHRMFGSAGQ